uniref:Uncharacterized protein n=1 Tax=Schistocephalus solidus TaxID=70667 RepID=A0A0X3NYH9_SCHSO
MKLEVTCGVPVSREPELSIRLSYTYTYACSSEPSRLVSLSLIYTFRGCCRQSIWTFYHRSGSVWISCSHSSSSTFIAGRPLAFHNFSLSLFSPSPLPLSNPHPSILFVVLRRFSNSLGSTHRMPSPLSLWEDAVGD